MLHEDERVSVWEALKRAWPIMIDRITKRLDLEWSGGTMSMYWAGDVLRVDIKFSPPSNPASKAALYQHEDDDLKRWGK